MDARNCRLEVSYGHDVGEDEEAAEDKDEDDDED